MSFVTRIIPESFNHLGQLLLADAKVNVQIGDVIQNDVLHPKQALKVNLSFKSENTEYNCVFKGDDMVEQACEWLFLKTEGEFNFKDVGPKWLASTVWYSHMEGRIYHD